MSNKKKKVTATVAVITAATLLLGGTYAWQSISQTALNEKEATINPGGRLHDDFNGSNKDVYVENFADEPIFARVRLDEYFEITMNPKTAAENINVITTGANKEDKSTYVTHKFGAENATDNYWNWTTGGSTVYMPTFNKNKDSLAADINGTYENDYEDYVEYENGKELTADATYDNDSNNVDDDDVKKVEETHTAKETGTANLISMEEWLALEDDTDNYWVYDTDGWVYWSSPIQAGTATGLLLDGISLNTKMDDSYYYAINVVAQFVTADDVGQDDNTGFYDTKTGTVPSDEAEKLLSAIGVDVKTKTTIYSLYANNDSGNYDLIMFTSYPDITQARAAAIADVSEDNVVSYSVKDNEMNDLNAKVSSVSFANKVEPTNMKNYFYKIGSDVSSGTTFNFTNLDTSNVTNMISMFNGCTNLTKLDLSKFDTSKVTDMYAMFSHCTNLTELNLSTFDTSNVTDMSSMFNDCPNLTTINFGEKWNTSNVSYMGSMFNGCSSLALDCSGWDVSNVISHTDFAYNAPNVTDLWPTGNTIYSLYANNDDGYYDLIMFSSADNISQVQAANIAGVSKDKVVSYSVKDNEMNDLNAKVSSVSFANKVEPTNMKNYFCKIGRDVSSGTTFNFTNLDTSNVTDMYGMFAVCKNLTELDLSMFDTSNVINMGYMFDNCTNLTKLNLSTFDTSNVTDMRYMFVYCEDLTELDLSSFDTSNVTDINGMFANCSSLTLDCSVWDVSNVTSHTNFAYNAPNVTEPNW